MIGLLLLREHSGLADRSVETTRREAVVPAVGAQVSKRVRSSRFFFPSSVRSSRYVSSGLPARIVKLGSRWGSVKLAGRWVIPRLRRGGAGGSVRLRQSGAGASSGS